MKIDDRGVPTIEATDTLIVETDAGDDPVQVYRDVKGAYHVVRSGIVRHPNGTADAALRAMGAYLQAALYKALPKV
jgi:hypothetical protein